MHRIKTAEGRLIFSAEGCRFQETVDKCPSGAFLNLGMQDADLACPPFSCLLKMAAHPYAARGPSKSAFFNGLLEFPLDLSEDLCAPSAQQIGILAALPQQAHQVLVPLLAGDRLDVLVIGAGLV